VLLNVVTLFRRFSPHFDAFFAYLMLLLISLADMPDAFAFSRRLSFMFTLLFMPALLSLLPYAHTPLCCFCHSVMALTPATRLIIIDAASAAAADAAAFRAVDFRYMLCFILLSPRRAIFAVTLRHFVCCQ